MYGGFDKEEAKMLRGFFRDEAHDHLESITRRLLHASKTELDKAAVAELMRATHTLKGSAATVGLQTISDCAHALEDTFQHIRSGAAPWTEAMADQLIEVVDTLRDVVDATEDRDKSHHLVEKLMRQMGAISTGAAPKAAPAAAPKPKPSQEPKARARRETEQQPQVLRIDAARVDRLMNSVGELVFDRTRIERRMADMRRLVRDLSKTRQSLRDALEPTRGVAPEIAERLTEIEAELAQHIAQLARSTSSLVDDAEALRQTTKALQDGLTEVRMASVHVLFERLGRSLRDIARAAGKRVELYTSGEDTEFDKLVADQAFDPLLQILRNAVAHGIEDEDERIAIGKPAAGQIRMSARLEGDAVFIRVQDDGMGIDPGALRRRFVESGLWSKEKASTATEPELMRAIFEPGVSTRDETDALAGRGVGLDAVRDTIARLGGDVSVESTRGQGTTFTLRLPITTAISQALLFKIHGQVYAVPNVHVVETFFIEASSPMMPRHLRHNDEVVPLVVLQEVLGAPTPTDARKVPAVIIDYAGKRLAVTCDRVIGPREIVVKSLGPLLTALPLYAGGTISGPGKVQLILDTAALVRLAHPEAPPEPTTDRFTKVEAPRLDAGRVLVVDDSRSVRETLGRMLSGAGFIVDLAENGDRALQMLNETPYSVLVTDIEMPKLDGFELLEKIRADAALAQLPAIVISSRTARANRDRAKMLGARRFIPKPVTRKKLLNALKEIFG